MGQNANFVQSKELTALAIKYKNPDRVFIADAIFPKSSVGTENFEYQRIPTGTLYSLPDTRLGELSAWPTFAISGEKVSAATKDEGIMIPLSNKVVKQAAPGSDPKALAVESATTIMQLRREVRAAQLAFSAATYPAGRKTTLAGADRWSDVTSSPIAAMRDQFKNCLIRPNTLALGQEVWETLARHPRLVKAARGNDSGEGVITREELARMLEINEVVVGEAWVNTAKPGEAVSISRCWGKHALGFYKDSTVNFAVPGVTFGLTAEYGTRVAGTNEKQLMGLRGGVEVYTGESLTELVISSDCAFFWENAVA